MGNSNTTHKKDHIDEINEINEGDLDLSKINRLQIKATKDLVKRVDKLEKEKQSKLIYQLPKLQLCNWSLI